MRTAALPLALATCAAALAAGESPIADLRLGVELGTGAKTEFELRNAGTASRTTVDDTPRRFSIGYVRGLGEPANATPIVGLHLLYGRGGGTFEDDAAVTTIGASRVDVTTLGLDLEAGYAVCLPSAPAIQVEATLFAGYLMQEQVLRVSSAGTLGFGGEGFESGARLSAIRTTADGWQVGATVRYLFESDVESDFGDRGDARVTTRGLAIGLVVGHRL